MRELKVIEIITSKAQLPFLTSSVYFLSHTFVPTTKIGTLHEEIEDALAGEVPEEIGVVVEVVVLVVVWVLEEGGVGLH